MLIKRTECIMLPTAYKGRQNEYAAVTMFQIRYTEIPLLLGTQIFLRHRVTKANDSTVLENQLNCFNCFDTTHQIIQQNKFQM